MASELASASMNKILITCKEDVYAFVNDGLVESHKAKLLVFSVLGSIFLDAYDFVALGAATGSLQATFHPTPAQLGFLTSSIAFGALLGALCGGYLVDRIGRLKMFMLDMVFFVVAAIVAAFAPSMWVLVAARFVMGIGVGIDIPAAFSFLTEFSSVKNKRTTTNRYLMYWYYATITAFVVALGFYFLNVGPNLWRWLVGLGAVPALALLALRYLYMDESAFWAASRGDLQDAARILRKIYNIDVEVVDGPVVQRQQKLRLFAIFKASYIARTISAGSINFLQAVVYFAIAFYLPVVSTILFSNNPTAGLLGAAGFQIFGLIGGTVSSRTASTVGLRRQALIGFAVEGVALVILGFYSSQLPVFVSSSLLAIIMLAHTFGPGQNGMSIAALSYPTEIRGQGTGFAQSMNRVGSIVGLMLFPIILGALGLQHTLLFLAIAPALAVAILIAIRWDPTGADADVIPVQDTIQANVTSSRTFA